MILTFEISKDKDEIEIIFNKEGYLALVKVLEQMKPSDNEDIKHIHLMTKEWGGSELTSEIMHQGNTLINHVKLVYIDENS